MGEPLDTNKELNTVGWANILSGLTGGFTGRYGLFFPLVQTHRRCLWGVPFPAVFAESLTCSLSLARQGSKDSNKTMPERLRRCPSLPPDESDRLPQNLRSPLPPPPFLPSLLSAINRLCVKNVPSCNTEVGDQWCDGYC